MKIGKTIKAKLASGIITGVIVGIGIHKGNQVVDIELPDGSGRFVYLHQIISYTMIITHKNRQITFDDLEYQYLNHDSEERTTTFECRGFDERGNTYSGIVEKCCDEYGEIEAIEVLVHIRNIEKKPYQARILLKSINYWQDVVDGKLPAKKPLKYYTNKLEWYTKGDIAVLIKKAVYS